jgi:5-methyltetrahydrofolate--homocysteine methyltransferase
MADLKALAEAVIKGDQNTAVEITKAAIQEGMAPKSVLDDGLIAGMDVVGARFKANEIYIPEVLIAARAMKMAMEVLEPELPKPASSLSASSSWAQYRAICTILARISLP